MMNKSGYSTFESVLEKGNVPLFPEEFEALANHESALVLDVRHQDDFVKSHIPNAIFIGLDGQFAPWVGALITDIKQPILLVVPEGRSQEAVTRLSRVGYDNTLGYLQGGIEAWQKSGRDVETLQSISAKALESKIGEKGTNILDVRKDGEFLSSHIEDAQHLSLDFINENMTEIDKNKTYHVHCAGGYRSVIAASILKARGFRNLVNVEGGFAAIKETSISVTDYVCPSTL